LHQRALSPEELTSSCTTSALPVTPPVRGSSCVWSTAPMVTAGWRASAAAGKVIVADAFWSARVALVWGG
jgi:hypothetical protein